MITHTTYRGYILHTLVTGEVAIYRGSEHIDTGTSLESAKALIDNWVEGGVR